VDEISTIPSEPTVKNPEDVLIFLSLNFNESKDSSDVVILLD
jgi:hypothetical protein